MAIEAVVILEGLLMGTGVEVAEARPLLVSARPGIGVFHEGDAWVSPEAGLLLPEGELLLELSHWLYWIIRSIEMTLESVLPQFYSPRGSQNAIMELWEI